MMSPEMIDMIAHAQRDLEKATRNGDKETARAIILHIISMFRENGIEPRAIR